MEGKAMTKKHWITLFTLTFFLTLFTLQNTFAMTALTNEELAQQTIEITTEDDYSIQNSPLPGRKDLGNGSGSISRMTPSQAKSFTKNNGTTEHKFKEDFVDRNGSNFDIFYDKTTRAVLLINKSGNVTVRTGYYFINP